MAAKPPRSRRRRATVQQQCELYKNLIFSERMRELVLSGEKIAGSLGKTQQKWIDHLHKANALYSAGKFEEGESARLLAFEEADTQTGHSEVFGEFSWLADGDDRLGPICEFICAGAYHWIPFSQIHSLKIDEPKGGSHLVWATAEIIMEDDKFNGFIPARYPVSLSDSHDIKVGTKTEWRQEGEGRYVGAGRRMWVSDRNEFSLFEPGQLRFGGGAE